MYKMLHHFIAGQLDEGGYSRTGLVFNPTTGEVDAEVPYASADEVDKAVVAAKTALEDWSRTSVTERSQIMFRFRELIT